MADVSSIPAFGYQPSSPEQTYTLLLVDLSIPSARVDASKLNPAQLPVAPGLGTNRTTRLHFWQAGLRFGSNGALVNTTEPVAFYQGPSPPPGDIAHAYVFYLFQQEGGFAPPPEDSPFSASNVNANPSNRQSFSVQRFATEEGVGDLVAANYIQVQNSGASSSSSGATRSGGASATPTTGSPTGTISSPSVSPFIGAATRVEHDGKLASVGLGALVAFLVGL